MPATMLRVPMSFPNGCGYDRWQQGTYGLGLACETRFDYFGPGPRFVADLTGIAAGYLPIIPHGGHVVHDGVDWLVTYNGTNTRVYKVSGGAWSQQLSIAGRATDALSFHDGTNSTFIVGFGTTQEFRYTIDGGANWVTSTKALGSSKYLTYGIVRFANRLAAQVDYVVDPNILYHATSMQNAGAASTAGATVGDNNTAGEVFTGMIEDDTGVELIGKSERWYSIDSADTVSVVAGPFPRPAGQGGGVQLSGLLDRKNFENPIVGSDGAIYCHANGGLDILRYYHGDMTLCGPGHQGPNVGPMNLPVVGICAAGDWILALCGTMQFTSVASYALAPYGASTFLWNTEQNGTFLFAGKWDGEKLVYHGAMNTPSTEAQYGMWFDPDTSILYAAKDSATTSQERCFFALNDPIRTLNAISGSTVITLAAASYLALGLMEGSDLYTQKTLGRLRVSATGLAAPTPALAVVLYPLNARQDLPAGNPTGAEFVAAFYNSGAAAYGTMVPRRSFNQMYPLLIASNTTSAYAVVREIDLEFYEGREMMLSPVL